MAAKGSSKASSTKSATVKASTPKMPKIAAPKATKAATPKVAMPKATKAATPKASTRKSPPKSEKRELINTGDDARYVKRNKDGEFKESDDVKRSQAIDKSKKAKTQVPSGYGDQGDQKPKAKKPAAKKPAAKKSGGR